VTGFAVALERNFKAMAIALSEDPRCEKLLKTSLKESKHCRSTAQAFIIPTSCSSRVSKEAFDKYIDDRASTICVDPFVHRGGGGVKCSGATRFRRALTARV
jgi:hypothetical protein